MPYVAIGVPLAAYNSTVVLETLLLSNLRGNAHMAAPVSIKKAIFVSASVMERQRTGRLSLMTAFNDSVRRFPNCTCSIHDTFAPCRRMFGDTSIRRVPRTRYRIAGLASNSGCGTENAAARVDSAASDLDEITRPREMLDVPDIVERPAFPRPRLLGPLALVLT